MKKVSIVVITYNEEKNIEDCLNSIYCLDYPADNYEVIVVDASEDNTPVIVKEKFPKVRLIKSKKGFSTQRNVGFKNSKYEHVAFIDADCIVPRDWLKNLVNGLSDGLAGLGGCTIIPPNTNYIGKCIACLGYPAGGVSCLGLSKDIISVGNSIFSKKILERVDGFKEDFNFGGEDTDLSKRIFDLGFKLRLDPNIYVYHKARTFKQFLRWNFRRGIARIMLHNKNPFYLLYPLTVFAYPFSSKFRKLIKNRKEIGINLFSLFFVVVPLFFIRQLFMSFGGIYGIFKDNH